MMPEVLSCHDAMPPDAFAHLMREAIFDCFKWHVQQGDEHVLCSFPLVIDAGTWRALAEAAEGLAREARGAEEELLARPELRARLGLPRRLSCLFGIAAPTPSGPRLSRFDFHPTDDGFRISEGNTDVAGGLIESSGVSALMARSYPSLRTAGDPAGALAAAVRAQVGPDGRVGLLHLTQYTEDRQIMLYLARRIGEQGVAACLFDATQLRFQGCSAEALIHTGRTRLDLVFRFLPAEWMERLPAITRWTRAIVSGRTPFTNPVSAVLSQSKRLPLVWSELSTPMPTWRKLLPETRSPDDAPSGRGGDWVIKPALGYEGDCVAIAGVTPPERYEEIAREASRDPLRWVAQRRFLAKAIHTPVGPRYPSVGVYVIDGRAVGVYGRLAKQPLIDDSAQEAVVLLTRS
jgi:glutathionylspermidine synthase